MKSNVNEGKIIADRVIGFVLSLFKWSCFIMTVIYLGFTLGLFIMFVNKGTFIQESFLNNMYTILSGMNIETTTTIIRKIGLESSTFLALAHGLDKVILFGLQYIIFDSVKLIYKSINDEKVFTSDNIKRINILMYLSIVLILSPVVLSAIISKISTGLDTLEIYMTGVVYFCIAYVAKLVFDNGYKLELKFQSIQEEEQKLIKKVKEKAEKEKKEIKAPVKSSIKRNNKKVVPKKNINKNSSKRAGK